MAVPLPPGGAMEMVFSFDTTGSMSSYLRQVKDSVVDLTERLFADIPALRMSIFAHGDYCDIRSSYLTKFVDLTNDVKELCKFVKNVGHTGGGDFPEAYEVVLRQVREELNWNPGTQRALVMIGDAIPHEASEAQNTDNIDWREEVRQLAAMGVRIYGVQCGTNHQSAEFFRYLAEQTGGKHLNLSDISSVVGMMMGVCYREQGPEFYEAYEKEVRARAGAGLRPDMDGLLVTLRDTPDVVSTTAAAVATTSISTATPVRTTGRKTSPLRKKRSFSKPIVGGAVKKAMKRLPSPAALPAGGPEKRRRHSSASSTDSSTQKSYGTPSIVTRSKRHQMTLRARNARDASSKIIKKKRLSASNASKVPRINRENVKATAALADDLCWTRWQLGLSPKAPAVNHDSWCPTSSVGMHNVKLFKQDAEKPAIYEVAVQTPRSPRRIPVFYKATHGFHQRSWDTHVLGSGCTRWLADRAVRRGCKLYVRRALCDDKDESALAELRSLIGATYDYSWRQRYDVPSRTYGVRPLTKNSIKIAENGKPRTC